MDEAPIFALDTVPFMDKRTTDSDPFGDKSRVQSASTIRQVCKNPISANRVLHNEDLRLQALEIIHQNEKALGTGSEHKDLDPLKKPVCSDMSLIVELKRKLLSESSDPSHLINVLIFWINMQVSQGMPNHNQVVVNVLQDMKTVFLAQKAPSPAIISQLGNVISSLILNLNNSDYDSTQSIVEFIQVTGVSFMRDYLLNRRVVQLNPETADVLTTWLYFQHIMKRQLPQTIESSMTDQLFDCMKMVEQQVEIKNI